MKESRTSSAQASRTLNKQYNKYSASLKQAQATIGHESVFLGSKASRTVLHKSHHQRLSASLKLAQASIGYQSSYVDRKKHGLFSFFYLITVTAEVSLTGNRDLDARHKPKKSVTIIDVY